jgi:hypothetical protein
MAKAAKVMESLTDPVFKPVLQAHSNDIYFKALEQLAPPPNAVWTLPPDMKCRAGAMNQMTQCAEELVTLEGPGRDALIAVTRDLLLLKCEEKGRGPAYIAKGLGDYLRKTRHTSPLSAVVMDSRSYSIQTEHNTRGTQTDCSQTIDVDSQRNYSLQTGHTSRGTQTDCSQTTDVDSQPVDPIFEPTSSIRAELR